VSEQAPVEVDKLVSSGEVERVLQMLADVRALVSEQAADPGLWFEAETAAEGYLQQELRKLHAAIEALWQIELG
jgi:hypothetical protein